MLYHTSVSRYITTITTTNTSNKLTSPPPLPYYPSTSPPPSHPSTMIYRQMTKKRRWSQPRQLSSVKKQSQNNWSGITVNPPTPNNTYIRLIYQIHTYVHNLANNGKNMGAFQTVNCSYLHVYPSSFTTNINNTNITADNITAATVQGNGYLDCGSFATEPALNWYQYAIYSGSISLPPSRRTQPHTIYIWSNNKSTIVYLLIKLIM